MVKQPLPRDASGIVKQRSGGSMAFLRRLQDIPEVRFRIPAMNRLRAKTTVHTEAVALVFNPEVVSDDQLLGIFRSVHDPAEAGGQGDYTGSRYRSVLFYHITGQKTAAENSRNRLAASEKFRNRSILTEILPATTFWPAEDYQQQFYEKCGQGYTTSGRSGSDCSPILRTGIFIVLISFP